ncbi:MAG: Dabb family protein [Vicinamibacterales bacterium]
MVAHVVLFTPKASMTLAERDAFVTTLETALAGIPQITRATVGRRLVLGRPYDAITPPYDYVAVIEFASGADLAAYLDHPAHDALAKQFYLHAERAAAYDVDMVDGSDARKLLA